MKKLFSILVLFAVLLSATAKTAVWGWYMANQSYIAGTLCENKAKPKMKCNGKCQLAKQLKKAEGESEGKNAPSLPLQLKEVKETEGNVDETFCFSAALAIQPVQATYIYRACISGLSPTPLLRPPIA